MDPHSIGSQPYDGGNPDSLLTPRELAGRLNMSLKWVEKHTQDRRIPGQVKVGRVWRYAWVEVQKRIIAGKILLEKTKGRIAQ